MSVKETLTLVYVVQNVGIKQVNSKIDRGGRQLAASFLRPPGDGSHASRAPRTPRDMLDDHQASSTSITPQNTSDPLMWFLTIVRY